MLKRFLLAGCLLSFTATAQPVRAPRAQALIDTLMARHPEMQTVGLHLTPPGLTESLNIACSKPGKVGKVSADLDTGVIASNKPSRRLTPKGAYDIGLPIRDAAGTPLGMVVIVIRETFTGDADVALKQASLIRDELQKQLPPLTELFIGGSIVPSPISMVIQTPLPDVTGGFDHFAADLKHDRLYIAAEENRSIEVFNLAGEHLRSATVAKTPHTLAFDPEKNLLLVADGGDSACLILDAELKLVKRIPLDSPPDAGVFETNSKRFYLGTGSTISIISVDEMKQVGSIPVASKKIEAMAIDPVAKLLYANLRDTSRIAVISLANDSVKAEWSIPDLTLNTTMALDAQHQRLFVAGRKPGRFFVIDTATGKTLQVFECVESADETIYDPEHSRVFVTGAGGISIFQQKETGQFTLESQFGTMKGKTSIYIPSLQQLYVIHAKSEEDGAGLQVYRVKQ